MGSYGNLPEVPLTAVRCEEPTSRHTGPDWRRECVVGAEEASGDTSPVCSPH